MTKREIKEKDAKLLDQFGFISGCQEHWDRIFIKGFRAASGPYVRVHSDPSGNYYLAIYLDPLSPIGQIFGTWVIPFAPYPEFHLNNASLHIYPIDEKLVRIEIRSIPTFKHPFNEGEHEFIYGLQIKIDDVGFLDHQE